MSYNDGYHIPPRDNQPQGYPESSRQPYSPPPSNYPYAPTAPLPPLSTNNIPQPQTQQQNQQQPPQYPQPYQNPIQQQAYPEPRETSRYPYSINEAIRSESEKNHADYLVEQITENVLKKLQSSNLDRVQSPTPMARTNSTSSPSPMQNRPAYTPPSPRMKSDIPVHNAPPYQQPMPIPIARSQPASREAPPLDRKVSSPLGSESGPARPMHVRHESSKEETLFEKAWGQLFNEYGKPTERLGQFLRGLANHIIKSFEPRQSIVITPVKMAKFYESTKLDNEMYPWSYYFKGLQPAALSGIYRDLSCQHHLIQDRLDEAPSIPGLTAVGFERWMTLLLMAHPDDEVHRLQKALWEMPINNADDEKERFPKPLSRRLFPMIDDQKAKELFRKAVSREDGGETAKPVTYEPAQPAVNPNNPPNSQKVNLERERKPYSNIPSESAIIDDDRFPPKNNNIERERAPYSAQPGGGKMYDGDLNIPAGNTRSSRANSTSKIRPNIPLDPRLEHHRSGSNASGSGAPARHRARSPPFKSAARSDNDLLTGGFSDFRDFDGEDERRRYARDADAKRAEWSRRTAAEEDLRTFDSPRDRERYDREMEARVAAGERVDYADYYRQGGRGYDYDYNPSLYR
ncbi:MAG: hypothetical protein M1829_006669 [Trizodia sp. TS-e1964]|nr:MAG: hypothetical protein M1829_006669 [Trizodia sp. TS-e1964]